MAINLLVVIDYTNLKSLNSSSDCYSQMNKSSTKPIFVLAILSFMLTLSHYGGVKSSVLESQFSINTATVEQSLNDKSQFDAIESNQTVGAAAVLSAGIVIVGILGLMKGKNSFKSSSTAPHSSSRHSSKRQESIIRLEQASRELQNNLLRLLHGDRGAASRLLSQVKSKNPGRLTNW